MDLETIFKSINKKMLIDFEFISSEIQHRGAKGRVREREVIIEYLSKYSPGNINFTNGEAISVDGQVSPEIDIVIHERSATPFLSTKEGYQIFPIETVYGVIEVKSFLDKAQLQDSFKKINQIKKMPKLAYEPQKGPIIKTTMLYDREWEFFPTIGMIIAFDSIDLKTLKAHYQEMITNEAPEHQIDSIWILKKGMLVHQHPGEDRIVYSPGRNHVIRAVSSDNPLMLLTIQLQSLLMSTWTPNFILLNYLQKANYGRFDD